MQQEWNLNIQKQFGNSTTIQIGYLGENDQHLSNIIMLQQKQLNADGTISPSPFLNPTLLSEVGQARFSTSNGISNYNALQIIFQQRLKYGLQAQLNYAWSKCLSDTPGFLASSAQRVHQGATIAGWAFHAGSLQPIGQLQPVPAEIIRTCSTDMSFTSCLSGTVNDQGATFNGSVNAAIREVARHSSLSSTPELLKPFLQAAIRRGPIRFQLGGSVPGSLHRVPIVFNPLNNGVSFLIPPPNHTSA